MLAWLAYWFRKPEAPKPPPITTIEVHPRNLYPYTRYTMTPPRLLEWWAKDPQLDPLPEPKEEIRGLKGEV
jgi:hypothetical protein